MRRKTLENTRFYTFSGALLPKMGKIIQQVKDKAKLPVLLNHKQEIFQLFSEFYKFNAFN
jgi:hypothetical protein